MDIAFEELRSKYKHSSSNKSEMVDKNNVLIVQPFVVARTKTQELEDYLSESDLKFSNVNIRYSKIQF